MEKSMRSKKTNYFHMSERTKSLDVLLLQDSSGQYSGKENPFDAHFRKAAEAVKQGKHKKPILPFLVNIYSYIY